MNRQELLHIDATPDENYPLRILRAYLKLTETYISDTSTGGASANPLHLAMNEAQDKRQAILEKAIAVLEKEK